MTKGFSIKNVITWFLSAVFIYFILMIIFQAVFYSYKSTIEKELSGYLKTSQVRIGNVLNIPFISIRLNDIDAFYGDCSVSIKSAVIYYNPLKLFTGSPAASIYHIKSGKIIFHGNIQSLKELETSSLTGQVSNVPLDLTISGAEFDISLDSPAGVESDFKIDRFDIAIKDNNLVILADMTANIHSGYLTGYLMTVLNLDFNYSFSEMRGGGKLLFKDVNAGGVTILNNEEAFFSISNGISFDLERSFPSKKVKVENGLVVYTVEKDVKLDYSKQDEYYLFEHIFNGGDFHIKLSYFTNNDITGFEAALNSRTNGDNFLVKIINGNGRWNITGGINSEKYGNGKTHLNISPGNILPAGFAYLDNFTIIPGLQISGQYSLEPAGNKLIVTGDKAELNGGPIGSVFTEAELIKNGLLFSSSSSPYNATMNGYFTNGKYEFFVSVTGIPGLAVVSNIGFDLFDVGAGNYSGSMHIYQDNSNKFALSAQINGDNTAQKKGGINYTSASLIYSFRHLSFRNIRLSNYDLNLNFDLDFSITNEIDEVIYLNGQACYRNMYNLPMTGTVLYNNINSTVNTEIFVDRLIKISVKNVNNISALAISAVQYPLNHLGLAGNLSLDFGENLEDDKITFLSLKSVYNYRDRSVIVDFSSVKGDPFLTVDHFLIDTKDDRLLGHGRFYQEGKVLHGRVEFDERGVLDFTTGPGSLNAFFQVKNYLVKDIIKDNLDVRITGKINFTEDIPASSVSASFRAVNAENSKSFFLDIPEIRNEGEIWLFNNIILRTDSYYAEMNINIFKRDPGYYVITKGKFGYYDFIKTEGSVTFYYQADSQNLFYYLNYLTISGRTLYGISGEIYKNGNLMVFKDNEDSGIHGYYNSGSQSKNWDLHIKNKDIQAGSSGSIESNIIQADFSLDIPLNIFSSLTFIKDIRGECSTSLTFKGNINTPLMNGNIQLNHAYADFKDAGLKLKDITADIVITNNRALLTNIVLTAGMNDFILEGSAYFKSILNPYVKLTLKPNNKKSRAFSVSINDPDLKITGNILINDLRLEGEIGSLDITGDLTVDNFFIYISTLGGSAVTNTNAYLNILNNMQWKVKLAIGNTVRFSNEFIDVFLKRNNFLNIDGSIADKTLNIKGDIEVDKGTLVYLGRDFTVDEGKAVFDGIPGDLLPYVNLESSFKYRDEKGETVEVFLTFTGKADNIKLASFSSVPPKSSGELSAVLGLQSPNEESTISNINVGSQGFIPAGVSSAAENVFIFNPLTVDLRRRLGLDMFVVRTGIIDTWARRTIFGESSLNTADIFEGSTISVGKYLIPDIFLQYDLIISRDPLDINNLIPLQTFGLDLDMKLFDFGWKIQPFTELGRQVLYEQFFEVNFNQKF